MPFVTQSNYLKDPAEDQSRILSCPDESRLIHVENILKHCNTILQVIFINVIHPQ